MNCDVVRRFRFSVALLMLLTGPVWLGSGCNRNASNPPAGGGDSGGGSDTGDNVLISDPLGFDGEVSGDVSETSSTRESTDSAAGQSIPASIDPADTTIRFNDIVGNPLVDENGNPIPNGTMSSDGTFQAAGLPVGTDFTICVDAGEDGTCDIETCVNIPEDPTGSRPRLDNVRAEPLTSAVLAKIRILISDRGIEPQDLPISPATVVARVLAAYNNLFEEAGIDHEIALADIRALTRDALAEFFDSEIPAAAQTGVQMVDGNLALSRAQNAEALALAVAELFLRAGFPVMDLPGAPDLSPLADLSNVSTLSRRELFGEPGPFESEDALLDNLAEEFPEDLADLLANGSLEDFPVDIPEEFINEFGNRFPENFDEQFPDGLAGDLFDPTAAQAVPGEILITDKVVYVSDISEPNRNHADHEEGEPNGLPDLPVLTDRVLLEMATLHLEGRRITLAALYDLLTSLDDGLGLRLTYFFDNPDFVGPPLDIFQTADGKGKAIDLERLFLRFVLEGVSDVSHDEFDRVEANVRRLLNELLGDTLPPTFEHLFDGLIAQRFEGIEALSRQIREAKAHLPFSRTGPSTFFVVADGDAFATANPVNAVTVDAEVTHDGSILRVTYNPEGNGQFYLGFTQGTEQEGFVEFIVRENGRVLHGRRDFAPLSIFNQRVFQPINGEPFAEFVSERGTFFPATHVTFVRDSFRPELDAAREFPGSDEQVLVLATNFGEHAEPVHVDFNPETGVATLNPFGRHLLMFLPDSQETGLFALFNQLTGQPASLEDPIRFFDRPLEQPADFDEFFNGVDDFEDQLIFDEFLEQHNINARPMDGDLLPAEPDVVVDNTMMDGAVDPGMTTDPGTTTDPPATREGFNDFPFILVSARDIVGLDLRPELFTSVFGMEVSNPRHNVDGDPFFDDINGNGIHDANEPTTPFRPTLFDPHDWRSTDIRLFYRRADNDEPVSFDEVQFDSVTPLTIDGIELVQRNYHPRLNAFRFGRPNTALNLLTAALPIDFFNGRNGLQRDTEVDIFTALAIINLVMDQVFNIEVEFDVDGFGPLPLRRILVDAHPFVAPVDDPLVLIVKGFRQRSNVAPAVE